MKSSPAPVLKSAGSYHHGDLRQALIDGALAELERSGEAAISLAALAKALGVTQSAPYRHFPERDALLAAVAARGFEAFTAALVAAAEGGRGAARLARMADAYVEFGLERRGLYALMFASSVLPSAAPGSELRLAAERSFDILVEALPPGGSRRTRQRVALGVWTSLHGVVTLTAQGLFDDKPGDARRQVLKDIVAHAQPAGAGA